MYAPLKLPLKRISARDFGAPFLDDLERRNFNRQMIDNYKSDPSEGGEKSPQQILKRLEVLQGDIEETQRWCDGVILQIAKGIEEAKEALGEKEESLLKRILRRIKK